VVTPGSPEQSGRSPNSGGFRHRYWGVKIRLAYLEAKLLRTGIFGCLDDWQADYPHLRALPADMLEEDR
jgi:hypothetical protein